MQLAIIGYGKMGKTMERLAKERGHTITKVIDIDNTDELSALPKSTDVAIEFTRPETAASNILACFDQDIPVVSGTTGWLDHFEEVCKACEERNGTFFYASNYSLGVNIFFKLNSWLAKVMNRYSQYKTDIEEIHHTQKLDKPSGTAITLAEEIIGQHDSYQTWVSDQSGEQALSIWSKREPEVPGTHTVAYDAETDQITIRHLAKSRDGFALGAVLVAEWLKDKKGVLSMNDFLKL